MADTPKWDDTEEVTSAAPSWDETEEVTPVVAKQKQEASDPAVDTALGGAKGYLTGKAANAIGSAGTSIGNSVVNNLGSLSKEQMSHITSNAEAYKNAPDLSSKLNEYRDLAQATRQKGFDSAAAAKASLQGADDIPVQEYFKALSDTAKSDKFSSEIAPNVKSSIEEQRLAKVRPIVDQKATNAQALEQKLSQIAGQEYVDPYQSKIQELEQMLAAPKADVLKIAREGAQSQLFNRRLQRVNEKLADKPDSETLQKRKEDMKFSRNVNSEKTGTIDKFKEQAKLEAMNKELAELKEAQKTGTAQSAAKKAEQIAKVEAAKAKVESDIANKTGSAKAAAEKDFSSKVLRTPEEIRNIDPDFYNNRTFDPDFAKSLDRAVSKGRNVEKLSPERLAEGILPSLRDNANFSMTGASSVDKFNTDISEGVRDFLGKKYPKYDEGMKASADAIATEDKFKKLGIAIDKDTGAVTMPESQRAKIAGILSSDSDKFIDEKALLKSLADDLGKQAILPANALGQTDPNDFLNTLKNSALKDSVKNTEQLKLSGYDAVNSLKSPTGAIKPLFDSKATKLQEIVALSKAEDGRLNKLGKIGELSGKYLPGVLGAAGALAGATSAANAGELTPTEATVAGTIDAVNPLPLDAVQGAVQGKKAYNDDINEQKMTEEYFNGEEPSQLSAIGAGAVGGAKGLVQPAIDLGTAIGERGTQASTDARSRMEQNMNASSKYTTPSQSKPTGPKQNDFLSFVDKNPEALKQLAETLSTGAGQSYAGPLLKAAEADDRTRSAILFGLYQQPAFRSLIGGESKMLNGNIPGVKKSQE